MLIDTVVGDVGFPTDEPLDVGFFPAENLLERFKPVQLLARQPRPESLRVALCFGV